MCPHESENAYRKLAERLRLKPLFGHILIDQLTSMLENSPIMSASFGDIVVKPNKPLNDHMLLLDGELELQRTWSVADAYDKSHTWSIKTSKSNGNIAILTAASRRLRARALSDIQFIYINASTIDELHSWHHHFGNAIVNTPVLEHRVNLVRQTSVFNNLPLENVQQAFERMTVKDVDAGEIVIKEGDKADAYYLIDEGEADIIRSDPYTGETAIVDHISVGDGFGEEALLQNNFRNATIRMNTPGRLLMLTNDDFSQLVTPVMLTEIDADKAKIAINQGEARLLDCRFDIEYEETRLPGAELLPLHTLRNNINTLDPDTKYIVYCRTGRRSKAAAFLLKERNFKAQSLVGGLNDWPYEVDTQPLTINNEYN